THVVLDTPGGIHGFELARVVMFADAIVMPVCPSLFDRESAAACHAELSTLPRISTGRCKLGAVGMRIDGRTSAAQTLADWAKALDIPFLGALRETQLYVRSLERGLTMFDLPPHHAAADLLQWEPIIRWLRPLMQPPPPLATAPRTIDYASRVRNSRPDSLMPAQEALVHGSRLMARGQTPQSLKR
ncbi:MAG: chromosome partitioning protein, partial [Ramlibacter sp.]